MKTTAKEIANFLQISPSAVSLALNGRPGVSPATRKRVIEAAEQLGYTNVKNLDQIKPLTNLRFIIYTGGQNVVKEISFYSIVLKGIEKEARTLGYNVFVSYLSQNDHLASQFRLLSKDVDGILLLGTELKLHDKIFDIFVNNAECPIIVVDNNLFGFDADCVATDNVGGAYRAIRFLVENGHTNIGYFCSKQRIPNFDERTEGILLAQKEFPEIQVKKIPVNFSTDKAHEEITAWLKEQSEIPTAFFSDSDIIAFGAMQAFTSLGYKIPDDISMIGFDDMPACEMVSPPLTSVQVMKVQMGKQAVQLLHNRIAGAKSSFSKANYRMIISTKIKIRQSVAPLKHKKA